MEYTIVCASTVHDKKREYKRKYRLVSVRCKPRLFVQNFHSDKAENFQKTALLLNQKDAKHFHRLEQHDELTK